MLRSEISRVRAAMCIGLLCVTEAACTTILGIGDPRVADDGGLGEAPMDSTVEGNQPATAGDAAPSAVEASVVGPTMDAGTADADATVRDATIDVQMEKGVLPNGGDAFGSTGPVDAGEEPGPGDGGYDANHDSGIDGETTGAVSGAACESNAQCQSNQVCLGSHCKNHCQTDLDCPTNWSCSPYVDSDGGVSGNACAAQCNPLSPQQADSVHVACAPGEACDIFSYVSVANNFTDCVTPGSVPTWGTCTSPEQCVAGDWCGSLREFCRPYCIVGTNDCSSGTCGGFSPAIYNGTQEIGGCYPNCSSDSDCPTNWTCNDSIGPDGGLVGWCYPHCNPLSPQQSDATHSACGPGAACDFFASASTPPTVFTDCVVPGTVPTNGSCSQVSDCVAGNTCNNGNGPGICRQTCRVGTNDCGAAQCRVYSPPQYDGTQQFGFCDKPCSTNSDCGNNELCILGQCEAPCAVDANCPTNWMCGTFFFEDGGVEGSGCLRHCNPLSPGTADNTHVACAAGQTCNIYYDSARQRSSTFCETVLGTSGAGQACTSSSDCAVGTQCVTYGTSTAATCSAYCNVASGNCGPTIPCQAFAPQSLYDGKVEIGVCHD